MANAVSKLEPYREFIATERRKKTTYRRIAELLAEKGIQIDYSSIFSFVKVRSKPARQVMTMWEPPGGENTPSPHISNPAEERPRVDEALNAKPELSGNLEAIRRLKEAKPRDSRPGKGLPSFREDAPLDRLSDEEARRLREQL